MTELPTFYSGSASGCDFHDRALDDAEKDYFAHHSQRGITDHWQVNDTEPGSRLCYNIPTKHYFWFNPVAECDSVKISTGSPFNRLRPQSTVCRNTSSELGTPDKRDIRD